MRTLQALALFGAVLSLTVACGDDSPSGGGGSGGEGAGATGGTNTGAGGATGGGGDGAGGGFCDEYLVPVLPPVQTVDVVVVNNSPSPIYLGKTTADCGPSVSFQTEDLQGQPVKSQLDVCELTCEELASSSCGCAADCALPIVTMIHPGGSYALSWTAIVYEDLPMPAECYMDPQCAAPTCPAGSAAAQPLQFLIDAYPDLGDCAAPPCTCDGGVAGSCVLTDVTTVAGTPTLGTGQWNVSDAGVTITFE